MSEIFLKIVNMSISAGYIVLAVLLLRLLLKKAPKWITVVLWGIVAVRLVCPFSLESALSLIPSKETVSPSIMTDPLPTINTGILAINSAINPIIGESLAPTPGSSVNPLQIWIPILTVVWVLGMVALLIYAVISYARIKKQIGTAVLLCNNVYQSENVESPFVLGIIKPKIYLPFGVDEKNLEYVVAHEMAHIHRKDHLWKPLGFLLLTLHWFNPLMWLGYVLLCRDIELACDEKVIKALDREGRDDYSEALLTCSVNRRMIAACPIAFGEVGVKARIKSILNYKKPAFWIILAAVVACMAVAVCFLTNPPQKQEEDTMLPQGDVYTDYEGVYITIKSIDKDEDGQYIFNIVWHNDTDEEVAFTKGFTIERKTAEEWIEIDSIAAVSDGAAPGYLLTPHNTKEKSYFSEHYDLTEIGTYRFTALFSIKKDDKWVSGETSFTFDSGAILSVEYLREQYPEYFDIDATNGLDIYVWQMVPNYYSFGILPHSEAPRDAFSSELINLRGVDAEQVRAILSEYNTDRTNMHIILWQNPLSSHLAPWNIVTEGETEEQRLQTYGESIRRMLFGEPASIYGTYVRENKNDIMPFSITLNEDGSYQYFECGISSHIGVGEYTFENGIVTLVDKHIPGISGSLTRTYKFRFEDGKLIFLAEESDDFMYIKLPDGAEFTRVEQE